MCGELEYVQQLFQRSCAVLNVKCWYGVSYLSHLNSEWKYLVQNALKALRDSQENSMVIDKSNAHSGVCSEFTRLLLFSLTLFKVLRPISRNTITDGTCPSWHQSCMQVGALHFFMCKKEQASGCVLYLCFTSRKLKHCIFDCLLLYLGLQFLRLM